MPYTAFSLEKLWEPLQLHLKGSLTGLQMDTVSETTSHGTEKEMEPDLICTAGHRICTLRQRSKHEVMGSGRELKGMQSATLTSHKLRSLSPNPHRTLLSGYNTECNCCGWCSAQRRSGLITESESTLDKVTKAGKGVWGRQARSMTGWLVVPLVRAAPVSTSQITMFCSGSFPADNSHMPS